MNESKLRDELKPDPDDRHTGRSHQSFERSERIERDEPWINFDDIELDDTGDRRSTRIRRERNKGPEIEEETDESEDETVDGKCVECRPCKRKKAASKPAPCQYMMMSVSILVLLPLIIGIGSALKVPSTTSSDQTASGEKNIDLAGNTTDQANGVQPAPGTMSMENTQQNVFLPLISLTSTQGQTPAATDGQQRAKVQGDLNNTLTQSQNQQRLNNMAVSSMLPTEPATAAPVHSGNASHDMAETQTVERPSTMCPARQQAAIKPGKPQTIVKIEPKPVAQTPKRTKPVALVANTKASAATSTPVPKETTTTVSIQTAFPAQTTTASAAGVKTAGNVGLLKSVPFSHHALRLSDPSSYDNLNGQAEKESLKSYVVYETTRNGQPWYVLVFDVYTPKEGAKKVVSILLVDVQAKDPWTKLLCRAQANLK